MQELEDPAERDQFQATIPAQLAVVGRLLNEGEETSAQDALELLIEVAEAHPRFLRRHLTELASAMLQVRRRCCMQAPSFPVQQVLNPDSLEVPAPLAELAAKGHAAEAMQC